MVAPGRTGGFTMVSPPKTRSVNRPWATPLEASFTCNVSTKVPVWLGVPPISPVLEFNVRPLGSVPDASDQV